MVIVRYSQDGTMSGRRTNLATGPTARYRDRMVANRRAFVAGLAVLAVLAMGFAVDGPRSPARRLSKTEVALTGIEPGGFGRAALKPVEDQGARPIRSLRLLLTSFGILAGLALFLGRRHRSGQGGVHVPHGIDWGPASVRGPPFLLA